MKPLLLLVDLQKDFLGAAGLEPVAAEVVAKAARLLAGARASGVPVVHAVTSVDVAADDRMPHWKAADRWKCVPGTPGHAAPPELAPEAGEPVVAKRFFSAFDAPELGPVLADSGADTLIVAGVHLHGCVRATVLDAYARGFSVVVAEDAVGSDDPLHAAVTRRYLDGRAARFAQVEELLAAIGGGSEVSGRVEGVSEVAGVVATARFAGRHWRALSWEKRQAPLWRMADLLGAAAERMALQIAADVGKPVIQGEGEVRRASVLVRNAASMPSSGTQACGLESGFRRVPLGVVAVVTPWNNPIAIPWGKIGPALALGNAVVWKPAPPATLLALTTLALAKEAGLPDGLLGLVTGDHRSAAALMSDPGVDAVSLSGSSLAGWTAQEICARRRIPLQAELGGNNAAVVWEGADLPRAAALVAHGAFAFAGQRCTANRRVIVAAGLFDAFLEQLAAATAALPWGDPLDPATQVGPLVSGAARDRVAALVARAASAGARVLTPHAAAPAGSGAYHPPTIVVEPAHDSEIVQEESFGPVLCVERARDFEEALDLVNGVRQGLVAALFAGPGRWRERFEEAVRAGILKWDSSTADADAFAPFGGWKSSGVGPPEHGPGNLEFYTRYQAIYGGA
jgi:acyl-CoA reductase-like NAD-dependent aldehyde dehydrogenase